MCIRSSFHKIRLYIYSNKYCSQLEQLKVAIIEKYSKLDNQKGFGFLHDKTHITLQLWQKLVGISCYTYCTPLTSHLWITTYFDPYKTFLTGKISILYKPYKNHIDQKSHRHHPEKCHSIKGSVLKGYLKY